MPNEEKPEQANSTVEQKPPKFTVQNLANAVPQINWSIITAFFGSLYNFTSRILWIFVVVVIATILIQGVTHHSTVIDLISVPKSLADNGYTSDVAAGRLRDAMLRFATGAKTRMQGPAVALHGDLPDIIVPTVGISLTAVTTTIRTLFRVTSSRSLTGELTVKDKLLWLRLRLDGDELYNSPTGIDPEKNPDDLFVAAVPEIFEVIRPYFAAVSKTDKDPAHALEVVTRYIDRLPESDENVPWLYNLEGNIYADRNDDEAATKAYVKAYTLNPSFAQPHYNLADLLDSQSNSTKAIAEYRKAIAIDPKYAAPHNHLGLILKAQGKTDEAIAEYRKAIAIDPKLAAPHTNLGVILKTQGKTDEAIAEYRNAIAIDPKSAPPHIDLGIILEAQGKTDEAIVEYRNAIAIDPNDALVQNHLSDLLKRQ
jgi:tetratricopeptide (TPR) repeat protein